MFLLKKDTEAELLSAGSPWRRRLASSVSKSLSGPLMGADADDVQRSHREVIVYNGCRDHESHESLRRGGGSPQHCDQNYSEPQAQ